MRRKLLTFALALSSIFLLNGCFDEGLSDFEVRQLIEQALKEHDKGLSDFEVRQLIEQALKEHDKDMPFTNWDIVFFNVKAKDWKWNDKMGQWEAFGNLPELTKFIYEEGAALGYVFVGTGSGEVQKTLPYVESYYDGDDDLGNPIYFTETISCDFHLGNPSTVGFFIKSSDLFPDENAPVDYTFRVVLIW